MTHLFAIIGDPIGQARSPSVFNALFKDRGVDAVMVPVQVRPADLASVVGALWAIGNFGGLVVTVPHKPAVTALLASSSERVRLAGAANVLRRRAGGWDGDLFDGEGFAAGLEARGNTVKAKHCAIVGAGGAGTAIALALLDRDAGSLCVWDIDKVKAAGLARRLDGYRGHRVEIAPPGPQTDIAINATPIGMQPDDPLPFAIDPLRPDALVADAIMKPPMTKLLARAAGRGHPIQEGRHMLDFQVEAIWRFFDLPGEG